MNSGLGSNPKAFRVKNAVLGAASTFAVIVNLTATSAYAADEASSAESAAADAEASETITVTGARSNLTAEKERLQKIPGTVSIVDNADVEKGRAANLEDVLAYQPGVFAVATGGNGANLVSIRGSGINIFYGGYARGIRYLYDGASISGPGGTQETFLTPSSVSYTEVLNGSNAFSYGALALGGAINFVTSSGRTAPGLNVGIEGGSYGYRKYQASYGGVTADGATDYYIGASRNERDGYQEHTRNSARDVTLNFGHQFSDRLKVQLIVKYREEKYFNGGNLTLEQIRNDPRHISPSVYGRKNWSALAIGKIDYTIDDKSRLELSFSANKFNLDNGLEAAWYNDWPSLYLTPQLRYLREGDTIFGLKSDTSIILTQTRLEDGDTYGGSRVNGQKVFTYHGGYSGSRDTSLAISNELHLSDDASITSGLSLVEALRDIRVVETLNPNTTTYPDRVRYDKWYVVPRLGASWKPIPQLQLFTSLGRSIDAPVTWGIGPRNTAQGVYVRSVLPQKGLTVEAGARANTGVFEGSLTLYRTWLHDEIHSIVVTPATATAEAVTDTVNASPTIHQGIEAALTVALWKGDSGDSVNLRQAYTYSDFYFRNDSDLGNNKLPGLPPHSYQAQLEWKSAAGFYAGADLRAISGYYADYTNSLKVPSYAIWGLRAGYERPDGQWKIYVDLKNLGNKHYAAAGSASYDYRGADAAVFWPGDGRSVFAGIAFHL